MSLALDRIADTLEQMNKELDVNLHNEYTVDQITTAIDNLTKETKRVADALEAINNREYWRDEP